MNTMIANAHVHLDFTKDDYPLAVVPSIGTSNWHKVMHYQYYALGIHPWQVALSDSNDLSRLSNLIQETSPVAIGECGLDYAIDTNRETQQLFFEHQLRLAQQYDLPIIIHSVKSIDIVTHILKKYAVTAQFHGFSGSYQQGMKLLEHGHYLSIGVYQKSSGLKQLINKMPIEQLLVETDEHHSDRLAEVISEIAHLRKMETLEVIAKTNENFSRLFTPTES